jgi:hypothetical protein
MRSGLATMMARARAREVATFSRCGSAAGAQNAEKMLNWGLRLRPRAPVPG